MPDLTLQRVSLHPKRTYGTLTRDVDGVTFAVTLEPDWDGGSNRKTVHAPAHIGGACVPPGRYWCKRIVSPKYGDTFELQGVPDRDKVLLHWGNDETDTDACILTGDAFDPVNGVDGITVSKDTFLNEFLALQKGVTGFWLTIKNPA